MEFQDRLLKYAKFNMSIRTASDNGHEYYVVTLNYGTKWKVIEPKDNRVKCVQVKDNGTYGYMTETFNGVTPIYDSIDETIRYNEEIEKKVSLFKQKAEELKTLFANEPYDRLEKLVFVIAEKNKEKETETQTKKKKTTSTKKETAKKTSPAAFETKSEGEQVPVVVNAPEATKTTLMGNIEEASEIDRKISEAMRK